MEETIIIGELQVWPRDLGRLTWDEANIEIAKLGPGWRLPTLDEFNSTLWPSRVEIPDISPYAHYWSNTPATTFNGAWIFTFASKSSNTTNTYDKNQVRPVLELTGESALGILLKDF